MCDTIIIVIIFEQEDTLSHLLLELVFMFIM